MECRRSSRLGLFKVSRSPMVAVDRLVVLLTTMALAIVAPFANTACNGPLATTTIPTPIAITRPPSPTPTLTSTNTPTPTDTPIPTPTNIPTPAITPSPTPTFTPPPPQAPAAGITPWVAQPTLIAPFNGEKCLSPITFQWIDSLRAGQAYQVTAYWATDENVVMHSDLLRDKSWRIGLPGKTYGEWRWAVSVVGGGSRLISSSDEWTFWFEPPTSSSSTKSDNGRGPDPTHER